MKTIKNHVSLSEEEEKKLRKILETGKPNEIRAANILLMSGKGFTPKKIAESLSTTKQTVNNVKQRFFKLGVDKCMIRKNAGVAPFAPKITGDVEAKITTIACSTPPQGRTRWTLELIANETVRLNILDSISGASVHTVLKKTNLSLI